MKTQEFVVAINDQGTFAPTSVGDFIFDDKAKMHCWKGRRANNMVELAEQVNGGLKSLANYGNQWITLRVVSLSPAAVDSEVENPKEPVETEPVSEASIKTSLVQANDELRQVVTALPVPVSKPSLALVSSET